MATPAIAVDVTLSLFGGMDTEISPSDIPEGLSPDNQDMIFLPGDTSSRAGLHKEFPEPFPGGVSVVYQKSYVQPNNQALTLILTSDGKLWMEDVTNSPYTKTQIGSVPAGLYAQSVSAFGREYIAFSDLLRGQGIPLQYDGTFLDRVTQDGPGAPPAVADENNSGTIAASPSGLTQPSTITIDTSPNGLTQAGNLVTVQSAGFFNFALAGVKVGDSIKIASAGVSGYNGVFVVSQIISAIQITLINNAATGLAASGGGTVSLSQVQVEVTAPIDFALGQLVSITGAGVGGYDKNYLVRGKISSTQYLLTPATGTFNLANSGAGTIASAGTISVGTHQVVQFFITRTGAFTEVSPAASWTAAGGKRAIVSGLAIGPANVVARGLGFTGAGGGNFFNIPATVTLPNPSGPPTVIQALIIPDNTTSQVTVDFSDNALFAAVPIDVVGNNLFDQIVLGTPMGFFAYASRLATWGDWNKVENFLNMGFDGGFLAGAPSVALGWSPPTDSLGGLDPGGAWEDGMCWVINGDSFILANQGMTTQQAYQDSFGDTIIQPNTQYIARFWASRQILGTVGSISVELYSPTFGSLAIATVPVAQIQPGGIFPLNGGGFVSAEFSAATPSVIPADIQIRLYGTSIPVSKRIFVDELEIIFAVNPYKNSNSRWSYALNPEAFAQTTGNLGPSDDESPIQNFSLQRNVGLLHTGEATHEFQDNNYEPGDGPNAWAVDSLTHSVGALSLRGCDPGKFGTGDSAEDWDIIASKNGVYIHLGADFYKVAQEMSRTLGTAPTAVTWDDINWSAQQTVWVKNYVNKRYALIGVPVKGATAPNIVFLFDYREMDTAAQIAAAIPLHITIQGKMKSSDLARKWSRWNVKANSAEILIRPNNVRELYLGGGSGSTPGTGTAYGNIYWLDPALLTDNDYGQIDPYYFTYAFVDHDAELTLQLGSGRHLYKHISAFISGVGLVTITPYVNSLSNPLPPTPARQLTADSDAGNALATDLEWVTGVRGQRVFFKIAVQPLPGTTDVQMKIQKMIVQMMKDPVSVFRGSGV